MNDLFMPLKVSASALEAQKVRINVIASNIANASTTRTPEGGPYRKRDVVFESYMFDQNSTGVNVSKIIEDKRPFRTVYD
ncbi:MAG: flagellar basal body protein, partial [Thermodesulfovibrionales bacterium]|nr:flagellar basal body protein [Thermodesulfovibrionales bacterium]